MSLDLIAKYYDLLYGDVEDDFYMWHSLLQDVSGHILEVGCGTGRLLLHLAEAGHTLTGLDMSELALSKAREKIEATGLSENIRTVQADMCQFDLPRKDFQLAFISLNTFMHCHSQADQLSTLQSICNHLQPGSQLIIDLFNPDPSLIAEADGRLYFEDELVNDQTGHTTQWYWRHDFDLSRQIRNITYILDEIDNEGVVRRTQIPFTMRFFYRYEMELLLKASGFTLKTIYGSYQLDLFDSYSPRMIFVAIKE